MSEQKVGFIFYLKCMCLILLLASVVTICLIFYSINNSDIITVGSGSNYEVQDSSMASLDTTSTSWNSGIRESTVKKDKSCSIELSGKADINVESVNLTSARNWGVLKEEPPQVILLSYSYKNISKDSLVIDSSNFVLTDRKGLNLITYPLTESEGLVIPTSVNPNGNGHGVLAFGVRTASAYVDLAVKYQDSGIKTKVNRVYFANG